MNSIQTFTNEEFSVRTTRDTDGTVWFVARDIAQALEYKESSIDSINKLMAIVPEVWKGRKLFLTPGGDPRKSITVIHNRNKERLDKFCFRYQIDTPAGKKFLVEKRLSLSGLRRNRQSSTTLCILAIIRLFTV